MKVANAISDVLKEWMYEGIASYLLEITIKILRKREEAHDLVNLILNKAGQKGAGSLPANIFQAQRDFFVSAYLSTEG